MKFLKKIVAVFLAAALMMTASISASAIHYDDYNIGTSFSILKSTAPLVRFGTTYETYFQNKGDFFFYKLDCTGSGTVTLNLEVEVARWLFEFMDSNGNIVRASTSGSTVGSVSYDSHGNIVGTWNSTQKITKASASFTVSKGTYYFCITDDDNNSLVSKVHLLATSRLTEDTSSDTTPTVTETKTTTTETETKSTLATCFTIKLKKGETVTLAAGTGVKWKTSKSSVATVTTGGKITAKKAGTATITASSGNSSMKIKVKVTS